jgi:hypothetical protein
MDELLFDAWPKPGVSARTRRSPAPYSVAMHRDNLDYLTGIEDGFFKLIVTSPPYNIGKEYENALR